VKIKLLIFLMLFSNVALGGPGGSDEPLKPTGDSTITPESFIIIIILLVCLIIYKVKSKK